jgi:TRAP-type mannitol/chloroaromatic compound transport system substrate-binding protein
MQRRSFIRNIVAGTAAATVAAPAIAQSRPEIQWRLAASWPKSLDILFGGADLIARRVAELTDDRFRIRTFAAGEIVPPLQVLDAVQAGTIEMGHTAAYYYFGKDPAFALAASVPFGPNTRQSNAWWHAGGGADDMAPLFSEYGCVALLAGNTGCQMGGWFRKEIDGVEDLQGLKFRVGGLAGLVLAKLGAVPQMIAAPDIYPSLEKGTLDGAEWIGPYDDDKLGFNRVATYYYYPGWWEGGTMIMALINEQKWNDLPPAYQAALRTACNEANTWIPAQYDAHNPEAMRRLVRSGTRLRPYPRVVLEAVEKVSFEVYEELKAKSAHWSRIYPRWKAFRDDQFLWYRVSEATYGNYSFWSRISSGS